MSVSAQNPFKEELAPVNVSIVEMSNDLFKKFVEVSKVSTSDIQNVEMVTYKDESLVSFKINYFTKKEFTYTVGFYYIKANDYALYYEMSTVDKSGVTNFDIYSESKEYLYSTKTDGKIFDMYVNSNIAAAKTPFSECMDRQEENFEDSFAC